ncbi:MAG: sensor histidine kinase, partial [Paracoccaceae bacterium]
MKEPAATFRIDRAPIDRGQRASPWLKLVVMLLVFVAIGVVLVTNSWLSERFTETTRNRAELRLALYSGNMISELQRTSVVPLLLSRDPVISVALAKGDFSRTTQRLIQVQDDIGVASILLLDNDGRTVGATNRNLLGTIYRSQNFFLDAQRSADTVFSASERAGGGYDFTYSQVIMAEGKSLGVIVVAVDLMKYERAWAGLQDVVLVTNSANTVVLATEPRWRGITLDEVIAAQDTPSSLDVALNRALNVTTDWARHAPDTYLKGVAVLKTEARVPFRGWRMVIFTAYDSVRERVNGILALEIMGFAILMALTFYLLSRRAWSQSLTFRRESAELRQLNAR